MILQNLPALKGGLYFKPHRLLRTYSFSKMQLIFSSLTLILISFEFHKYYYVANSQELIYVPRTNMFARWPMFGGFRNFLQVVRPHVHVGRKSDYRSDFDENYINYHRAQMWKILFTHETNKYSINRTAEMKTFVEKYAFLPNILPHQYEHLTFGRGNNNDFTLLVRTGSVDLSWVFLSSEYLYDNTMESIPRLIPTDVHPYNIRSRNDLSVVRYYGYQLWKIHENNVTNKQLNQFFTLFGNEVWNINQDGIDIVIDYRNTAKAKEFMATSDFTYNIMIDDLEEAIDETYVEVNNTDPNMPWLDREGTIMNWNRYHDIDDIKQFMQYVLEYFSEISEIIQIGVTKNKRPLEVLRISNGNPNNRPVFIVAGYQGRDWLSPAAVTLAISKLTYLWDSPKSNIMHHIDWYFLPVANPDGYQYSRITDRLWTKNRYFDAKTGCFGVNLDRNFEYKWGGSGSSENPCKNLYKGAKEFSEPETRAIRNFILNMKNYLGSYISFGGYGQEIAYPWGDADFVTDNQKDLHKIARKAITQFRKLNQAEYRVGSSYRLKLARAGNSADWIQYYINPHYVYNVFLKDQGRYGYLMPPHYIVESGEEVYEFMKTIAFALDYK